jgi:hypothetical protein
MWFAITNHVWLPELRRPTTKFPLRGYWSVDIFNHFLTCDHTFRILFVGFGIAQSIYWLSIGLDGRGSIPNRIRSFSFLHSVQTGTEANPASYPKITGVISLEVKRPEREANHSPPSSVEIKNGGTVYPLPHMSSWRGASLIKQDNLTFTFTPFYSN